MTLHHRQYGSGSKVLILIPGLGSDHSMWRLMIRALAQEYTVIAVDNRGAGRTRDDGRAFSIEDMANDIIAVADAAGVRSILLAGHSMGGAIAQVVAYRYPERVGALALCNTFTRFDNRDPTSFCRQMSDLYRRGAAPGEIARLLLAKAFSAQFISARQVAVVRLGAADLQCTQTRCDYRRQLDALNGFDSGEWVGSLRVPTLVIDSVDDAISTCADTDRLVRLIADAQRITLPGGHASAIEQPVAFSRALLTFFLHSGGDPRPRHDCRADESKEMSCLRRNVRELRCVANTH